MNSKYEIQFCYWKEDSLLMKISTFCFIVLRKWNKTYWVDKNATKTLNLETVFFYKQKSVYNSMKKHNRNNSSKNQTEFYPVNCLRYIQIFVFKLTHEGLIRWNTTDRCRIHHF